MMPVYLQGMGIAAPGLVDSASLSAALEGQAPDETHKPHPPQLLSPRERRRSPETVRWSFSAAEHACAEAGIETGETQAVFSSGNGDLEITDYLCRTLAEHPELISPTRFHNSVHNAAVGYWSIGAGVSTDVTAVSGWRDSVTAGLIETAGRLHAGVERVLLVVYDGSARGPMRSLVTSRWPFCAALVLARTGGGVALELGPEQAQADHAAPLPDALAERVADNPAARMLHLMALALTGKAGDTLTLAAEQGPGVHVRRTG